MTELLSTILHLQSVPNGLAWKPSSSSLIIYLCLFTVTSSYATQAIQAQSALRNVRQVAEEDDKWMITWLTTRTLWPRAHSTWHERNERRRAAELKATLVSEKHEELFSLDCNMTVTVTCPLSSYFQGIMPQLDVCMRCKPFKCLVYLNTISRMWQ